jgi:AAA15 family ATPase/GTPase
MYESIRITRFRQFQDLELGGLTRVNLFVGRNNAGKTSILEAVELLASGAITPALLRSGRRRGEPRRCARSLEQAYREHESKSDDCFSVTSSN